MCRNRLARRFLFLDRAMRSAFRSFPKLACEFILFFLRKAHRLCNAGGAAFLDWLFSVSVECLACVIWHRRISPVAQLGHAAPE
jgi:hypothetical protein